MEIFLPSSASSGSIAQMQLLATLLPYVQVALAILLGAGIILQQTGTTVGGAFGGGDNFGSGFHTRRGVERILFNATIVIAILFVLSAFVKLIIG
jgi:preprotein translocase subunit SecG